MSTVAPDRVVWDGQDEQGVPVASGIYFARLSGGNGTSETTRIAVLR